MLYSYLIACVLSILSSFFYTQSSLCTSTISQHAEALASFVTQCTRQPVLEILYAWTGYDIWEGASKIYNDRDKEKSPFAKTLTTEESTDVTNIIKATLNNGGIYIQRADKADATTLVKKETRYGANSTVGPVAISQGTSVDSLALQSKTVGIIYRDYKGIHFRRFESWQNIMLPCPTDMNITSGNGGYFYGHQFEENGTRGLVTVTSRGEAGLSFMATDRMANSPCTSPIDSPDNLFKGDDGRYKGLAMPWRSNGVDFRALDFYQQNLFHCHFRPTGSIITLLHTFRWHAPNKTIKETDQNYKYSYWFRKFYDNNGTLQDIPGADNLDSSITSGPGAICYPSGPNAVDVWFAFDNTTFSFGLGRPNSQADIDANPTVNRVLCTRSHPGMRYYRYFGFWANRNTNLTNIESKVLNPGGKFCTPPFLRGKFLFWRNEWLTPAQNGTATDLFSIKFKARGDTVHVALGQKTGSARLAGAAYDTTYSYALRVTNQTLTIEKQNSTTLLPVTITQGAQLLAGSDKERAYDYWLTFANGTIQFGHGTTIGENIVAQAIDPAALKNNTSFSFSSNARSVDYTDIVCAPYQPTTRSTNTTANDTQPIPGTYTQWPAAQTLQAVDQGAIIFSYKNTAEEPAAESHSVMVGLRATLPTAAEIANQSVPDYQILIGSRTNTAHEILRQTNPVKLARKPNNDAILPLDTEWHDMWLLYSGGSIAYGSGAQIGMNMLGSWVDPNPIARIRYFSFTSFAPTMEFKLQSTPTLEPQRTCTTQHGTTPKWATLWQFETPNQGAFSFAALSATATGTVQVGLTNATQSYPPYEIIINDTGKAYIRKDRLIQTNSITTLTEAQIPTGTAKKYWIAYKNGTILLGMGTNPLAPDAILLQWQDAAFNQTASPSISRFVFASANAQMQYSDITVQPFDAYDTALNTTTQTLIAQNTAQTQWASDPTRLILPASTIKLLYWHPTLRFTEPGKTTLSCVVQKKDANPLKIMMGLNDAGAPTETPVLPLTSAAYCLTIGETGLIEIRTRTGALLSTSPACVPFQKLADSAPHTIWVTITTTQQGITLTFGIDTPIGSSPAYTYTIAPGAGQMTGTLTYFGIGADNCAVEITDIKANLFIDATSTTTNGLLKYSWQPGWTFTQPDQGQVSFNLAAQQSNNLIFAFGLGTSSVGANGSTAQLNDAAYTLALDYTGQIYLLKAPDLITKLGQVRYSDMGDLQKHAEVLKVSSTAGAPCTINYDRGRFLVKIGNTTVWSYTDPTPVPHIRQFSFASLQSTALITNIITRGGESLRTIEQLLATPQELIATDSATFVSILQTTLMERLHIKNLGYLFDVIIPAISSNQELFNGQTRVQLLGLMKDINAEPIITPAQKNTLPPLIATLTNALDYQALIALYATAIESILGSTTPQLEPLKSNDARRILFFKKLQKITNLPSTETSKPGFLLALQNLVNGIPSAITYTADEQKIIAELRAMSSNETILANSQDPDTLLKTIPTIFDKNSQVDALVSFISKRHQARMNPARMPIELTAQQASLTLDLIAFLIDNRDELSSASQKNCMLILQLAKASPDITMARTTQGASTRTIQQLMDTLNQPIPLSERITKLQNKVSGIILTPSTDPLRQVFFSSLVTLKDSLQGITPDLIKTIQDSILNPFFALNIPANESAILTDLQAAIAAIQTQNISCKAQIKLLQDTQESMKNYIEGLLVMLQGKGVTTQFAPDDFDLFLAQLEYAVDSRELIDAKDIPTLINIIKLAQLTPEFAPHSQELTALLNEATTEHTFADRIAYAKQELDVVLKRKSITPSTQTTPDYYYKRLVEKLSRLMTAPGIKTEALFNDLEANVLNPLLSLTTDSAQLSALQTIRSTLVSTKAQIIESQKTFGYHFSAAVEQKNNPSMYISMLKNIIENERNGLISFDNTVNGTTHPKPDAQIFTEALTEMVALRDTLSSADITLLQTSINYALYSKAYSDPELKTQLVALYDAASKPTPFAERVQRAAAQAATILSLLPTDPLRITFMKNLKTLLDAPGEKTPEVLNLLQTAILTPFSKNLLQEDEQVIITQLTTLATTQQETTRTASYQMSQLAAQPDFAAYINGLQAIFIGKGTRVTFLANDYKTFVEHLKTITASRELLSGQLLITAQDLINSTLLSAEFAPFSAELRACSTQIKQPFYFNERVAALSAEAKNLSARNATGDDAILQRVCTKLELILLAPQLNTTDKEFNDFEVNVLSPLSRLALNESQKSKLEQVRSRIRAQKAQILASQTTFRYHFTFAQEQKDSTDAYITSLKNIMQKQREGSITFIGTDSLDLLTSLKELVTNRDELTSDQLATVRALISYCAYSSIYKDTPDAAVLTTLYQQTTEPIAIAQLITKYSTTLGIVLGLASNNPVRIKYFTQLENLTQNNESLSPILVQDLTTKILTPLKDTMFNLGGPVDPREASIIQKLEAYTSIAGRKAQSVSYLLQIADDTNLNLFDYAQAVCTIMQQKGTSLTFTSDDIVKTVGALSYVTASRELLNAQQITALQQFIAQIIWLGTFNDAAAQLQSLSDALGSLYTFSDRIKNASQELKVMILGRSNPTSNRMTRFVERLKIILNATGTATPADFDALQNTILAPLQRLALPDAQKQIVADIMAKVASSKDAILSAQKTFAYNFQQAQLIEDNISNYIAALQNIITLKRQATITFEVPDYRIFLDALTITGDQRDALSSSDLTNLKNTVNYTYYSKGFAENPQYQKELTALYNTLNTPVTFASRITQYSATIAKILQLDTTNLERQRFFNKLKLLPNLDGSGEVNDVEKFAATILAPLQAIPLSPTEQSIVTALTSFVANIRDQARQLSYNIKLLFGQIVLAQNDTSKNSIDVLISGLNDIIIKRNSGSIIFSDTDYPQVLDMINNLVENRELFNDGQISRVQSLIRAIQFGAGFEKYKDTLDALYKKTAIALTFNERITKYRNALPQMNSSPTDDPSKNEFINMISSVFNAPGNRTLDMLTSLESEVLNPIKFGNFTTAQKQKTEPLSMRLAAERTKINSFAYRFNLAQSEVALDSFYKALTLLITDYSNGALTLSATEYGIIMAELELQGTLRPLSPTTQSELYSLIQMVKTAPVFATRVDLKERLTALSDLLNTPVDPVLRANYFIQTTMSMLSKLSTDGARNRYFALLAQFSSELSTLSAEKFNTPTTKAALTDLQNAFNQYRLSTNATENEKGIMNDLIRQLQDVILTLPAVATTPITPNTTTPPTPSSQIIPTSTTVTTQRAPTVARFYRSVPTSRFAQ